MNNLPFISAGVGQLMLQEASPTFESFTDLSSAVMLGQQALSPRVAFDFSIATKKPIGFWLSSPTAIRRNNLEIPAISSREIEELHGIISLSPSDQASEERAFDLIERCYATEGLASEGFIVFLRTVLEAKNPALALAALAGIEQQFRDAGDMLILSLAQTGNMRLRTLGRSILPYSNIVYAALEADRLLTVSSGFFGDDEDFIRRSVEMWWSYSGAEFLGHEDRKSINLDEFREYFKEYSEHAFPSKAEYLELASNLAKVFAAGSEMEEGAIEKIKEIDDRWAECLLVVETRSADLNRQAAAVRLLERLRPECASGENKKIL